MAIAVKDANNVTQNIETITDAAGNLVPCQVIEGQKATYRATATALVTVASATDVFLINGSASKTVRVTRVAVSGSVATTASYIDISLIKRSTANSAGTSSATAVVPLDSGDAAGTAVVLQYTANPTVGTAVGAVAAVRYFAPITATATVLTPAEFKFGDDNGRTLVLRGVAQGLAVSFNTGPALVGTFDIMVEWTEE
jgi:hypothetical protein